MRVWDLSPGYLSRQSLLGEHRELHGIYNIITGQKQGYSRHPETMRWVRALPALRLRHALLAEEMALRGYTDRTPLASRRASCRWPGFVTEPVDQIALLRSKYGDVLSGRIPLPTGAHQLWAQHKYSVLARDQGAYREIGRAVARLRRGASMDALARDLVAALRVVPPAGSLVNALQHMWGYVAADAEASHRLLTEQGTAGLMQAVQALAMTVREPFLLSSTALGELAVFARPPRRAPVGAGR